VRFWYRGELMLTLAGREPQPHFGPELMEGTRKCAQREHRIVARSVVPESGCNGPENGYISNNDKVAS
jgi:hypothetical protein